jgi:hypothetical protein
MASDDARCPGCGCRMRRVTDHGVHSECESCGGRLLGLSPFEQLLQDGVGQRIWVASTDGPPGPTCTICSGPMRLAVADGVPEGLAVCHLCQQVFVPAVASGWMAAHARDTEAAAAIRQAPPEHCENCGAPFQADELGRCRFCHTQLVAPQPIEINIQPAAGSGDKLVDALASLLTRPVD